MKFPNSTILGLFAFSVAALASVTGIKVFTFWSQVLIIWESGDSPLLLIGHPHVYRFLIVYPGFLLEECLPSMGFSLYIAIFFACNIILFRKISLLAIRQEPSLFIYILFSSIHLFMNGRGVIIWTAWLLCVWVIHKISLKKSSPASQIFWVVLSSFLSTVSTGVFIVVIVAFSFLLLANIQSSKRSSINHRLLIFSLGSIFGYIFIEYFVLSIEKNTDFYGGGIPGAFNMLQHGMGAFIIEGNLINAIFFGFFVTSFVLGLAVAIWGYRFSLLDRFMGLTIFGGLFGFTVLTLLFPLLLMKIQKVRQSLKGGRERSDRNSLSKDYQVVSSE